MNNVLVRTVLKFYKLLYSVECMLTAVVVSDARKVANPRVGKKMTFYRIDECEFYKRVSCLWQF